MKTILTTLFLFISTITFSQSINNEYYQSNLNRQLTGLTFIGVGLTSTAFASYTLFRVDDIRFTILIGSCGGLITLAGCIIITEPRQLYKSTTYQLKTNGLLVRF